MFQKWVFFEPNGLFLTANEGDDGAAEIECKTLQVGDDFRGIRVLCSLDSFESLAKRTYLSPSVFKQLH